LRFQGRPGKPGNTWLLQGALEKAIFEAVGVKLKIPWEPQKVGDASNTCLPRKVTGREQNQSTAEAM
jgi:hypothetical protein